MNNTWGDFAVAVAFGQAPSRTMSSEAAERAHLERCEAIAPAIKAIRRQQRLAAQVLAGEPLIF